MLKGKKQLWAVVLTGLFAAAAVCGQEGVTPEERQVANDLFTAQDWAKAAAAYSSIAQREPTNANAFYRLGYSHHAAKQYDKAIEAYERAAAITPGPVILYNLACSYALKGDTEKAFNALDKAVAAGFGGVNQLKTDADLAKLRALPRFAQVVEKAERAARPCDFDPRYRQFDFWVGEWEVRTQQGQIAGYNSIQKASVGCALLENWTSQTGGEGKSLNFFDPGVGKWRQVWMGANGGVLEVAGVFKDGNLYYEGEMRNPDGTRQPNRLTFFKLPNGNVRQLGEQSNDGGKTWTVTYDFIYVLKKTQIVGK
jgi:tetratricopeptide (TPR) repeat protein